MAPFKAQLPGSQKITSFFSRFTIPKERRPDPETIENEIVVASSRSDSQQSAGSQHDHAAAPQKRKRSVNDADGLPRSVRKETGSSPKRGRAAAPLPLTACNDNASLVENSVEIVPTLDSLDCDSPTMQPIMADSPKAPAWSPLADRTKSIDSPGPALSALDFRTTTASLTTRPPASSSLSAVSTAPKSSAPSTNALRSSTSSRRIMKDGLKAIANSDSDMSDDSSDGGLADPGSFFARRRKISPVSSKSVAASRGTRLLDTSRYKKSAPSYQSPPRKVYRHSLASLSREGQKMREAEASIASMKQAVEDSKQREEEAERQAAMGLDVDGDTAALLDWASDDEEGERRVKALQRVEALHATDDYHFFLDSEPLFPDSPFPVEALPNEPWRSLFATDMSREQACISGFAAEMVAHFPLPMAITNWLAQQLLHEQNETLCEAYVDILRASSAHPEFMSDTVASLSSMYKTRSLFEHDWKDPVRRGLPAGLDYVLNVVQFCAPASDGVVPEAEPLKTIEAFLDLAMMNLDRYVKQDISVSLTLAKCIEELLDSLWEGAFEKLVSGVLGMLDETQANLTLQHRCCLVASLPSRTARSYQLRRRIALDTFVAKDDRAKAKAVGWDWLGAIHRSLRSREEFDVKESTDFDILLPMVEVLDIAVAAGFTDYDELHTPHIEHEKRLGSLFAKAPPLTQVAISHNDKLDAIVAELQYMKSKIQHEATHLRRQEVKAALDRSIARIETSVRTRPKPKKSVFGNEPKQARFDRKRLTTVDEPVRKIAKAQGQEKGPVTTPEDDDLPIRPGIDDIERTPSPEKRRGRQMSQSAHERTELKEIEMNDAELEDASSDDFHTAYEISQPRI
ncbi:hypothetical protein Slin14017_G015470 [Septoria linicola]|nr:hypothetical protein Slin14017_G015470 [Septoria linicola]